MLRPCPGCRRHVAAEPACPFCGIALPALEAPRSIIHGRFSRAAVFAGATLAGCWTGKTEPASSAEHRTGGRQQTETVDIPKDPGVLRTSGTIEGVMTNRDTAAPILNSPLELVARSGGGSRMVATDATGHYVFTDVAPGDYDLIIRRYPRRPPDAIPIKVGSGAKIHQDVSIVTPQISNVPMPYGAPPARRRLV